MTLLRDSCVAATPLSIRSIDHLLYGALPETTCVCVRISLTGLEGPHAVRCTSPRTRDPSAERFVMLKLYRGPVLSLLFLRHYALWVLSRCASVALLGDDIYR